MGNTDGRLCQALRHHLPRFIEICPWLEIDDNRRQSGDRFGVDDIQPGNSGEQILFHRNRDHLFHLLRGKAQCFGLNLHIWRRKLWQCINWCGAKLINTHEHHYHGESDYQKVILQACPNNSAYHGLVPPYKNQNQWVVI